jgi:hypothetical protein
MARKKPWHRPRNVILSITALVLLVLGREVYLALTAEPGKAVNYPVKMRELIESNQPPDRSLPDGWPVLQEAIALLGGVENETQTHESNPKALRLDFSAITATARDSVQYDKSATWEEMDALATLGLSIAANSGLYDKLDQLAATRRAVRPTPDAPLIEILLPELGRMRQLARMNGARMFIAARDGNEAEFVRAYEQTLALGRISAQQGCLIEHLVGIAIVGLANGRLREAMTERPFSPETCAALLAAIDRQLPLTPVTRAFDGERLGVMDMIQWTHTDDGRGSGRLIPSSLAKIGWIAGGSGTGVPSVLTEWKIFNIVGAAFPSKAATTDKANDFFDKLTAHANLTPAQRRASPLNADTWIEENLPKRYLLLRLVLPAVDKSLASHMQCEMETAGVRIMLALELYKAKHNAYPATLVQLAPSFLPAIPEDPFAGDFVYRLITPEEDAVRRADGSARPYLLYSRGRDMADNGGKTNPRNAQSALHSDSGKGLDFVLNTPADRAEPKPPDPAATPE